MLATKKIMVVVNKYARRTEGISNVPVRRGSN
jgi:hypothetical protein